MPEENIDEEKLEAKAKLEAKVRREVMRLFIEEAKLEATAKEQKQRLLEEKEGELKAKAAKFESPSKKEAQIIKIPPKEEQLELDLEALEARARLEERIRREKQKGKRIIQGIVISCAIIALAIIAILNQPKGLNPFYDLSPSYDLVEVKEGLQKLTSYYGQFVVEDVVLSGGNPFATLNLGFSPSSESDLKDFVESLVERYSMAHPAEKLNLLLKRGQRVYAKVSYAPHTSTIDIELTR